MVVPACVTVFPAETLLYAMATEAVDATADGMMVAVGSTVATGGSAATIGRVGCAAMSDGAAETIAGTVAAATSGRYGKTR